MFRIEAIAVSSGIATAGSVPKTNSRMISAPSPPMIVSPSTEGPLLSPFDAADSIASRPVTYALTPGGALALSARCVGPTPESEPKPGRPGRKISAKVVWPSFETYCEPPVVKYELERAP